MCHGCCYQQCQGNVYEIYSAASEYYAAVVCSPDTYCTYEPRHLVQRDVFADRTSVIRINRETELVRVVESPLSELTQEGDC